MRVAFCADIHIGAPNTNLQELMGCFEMMISSSDLIVIGGDILDAKYHTSSENISLLLDLMDYITPMIFRSNKILRLIYGTQSHDGYPQLQILNPYTAMMNFRIISHVSEETILKNKILYIPEEIIGSKQEYYAETLFSDKTYDYIFGHGVIAEGMPMVRESKVKKVRSVPIFRSEELSKKCLFHCCFGHYHRHTDIDRRVHYVGSLTRFRHAEPEPKGWFQIQNSRIDFIENPWSPIYTEHKITCQDYTPDDFQAKISSILAEFTLNKSSRDRLKFHFYLDRRSPDAMVYADIIRTLCKLDGVSYAIKDTNELVLQEDPVVEKYDYILDQSIPIKDKINRYNESEFEGEIDQSLLQQYLDRVKVQT